MNRVAICTADASSCRLFPAAGGVRGVAVESESEPEPEPAAGLEPPRVYPDADIRFSGFVSWVGTSSLELWVNVWQLERQIIESQFVFVARDSTTMKTTPVNPLSLETPEDHEYFQVTGTR